MSDVYYIPQTAAEVVKYCCQPLSDVAYRAGVSMPPGSDLIQPKMDGWWVALQVTSGMATVITRGAEERRAFVWDIPDCLLVAEWMYGTNWSNRFPGMFYVHDGLYWDKNYWGSKPYGERFELLATGLRIFPHPKIETMRTMIVAPEDRPNPIDWLWKAWVIDPDFEGLVFKTTASKFGAAGQGWRMKRTYTLDLVATAFVRGGGKNAKWLGTIAGSQYDESGKLRVVAAIGTGFSDAQRRDIWENRDKYMGKVFEAHAWGLFPTGAPRHSSFLHWREDKKPEDCLLVKREFPDVCEHGFASSCPQGCN